jgi:hypothetical protein
MALLSARARARALVSLAMAIIVAIAGVPILYGVVAGDTRCAITLDICHPVQSVSSSAAPLLAPPPAPVPITSARFQLRERLAAFAPTHASRPADAPDPPPPKSRA